MLQPSDRTLLREAFRPPVGYELHRAVSTTFSLDLMALLSIPVSFSVFQLRDYEGPPSVDPLALLESLRRYAERITVFCQAGKIHAPKRAHPLFGYVEDSVHAMKAPREGGLFHPKLTVLKFAKNADGPGASICYRLLCSSRNLTFDRSWDTLLILDGDLAERRSNAYSRNRPLSQFVGELVAHTVHPLPKRVIDDVNAIADELLRVEFVEPEGIEEMEFCPLGFEWSRSWPILQNRRTLAVAPFVDDGFARRFADRNAPLIVASRLDTLDRLAKDTIEGFVDARYLNDAAEQATTEPDSASQEFPPEPPAPDVSKSVELTPAVQLYGLHAKLFVADDGWNADVWTGSANATLVAFERNVEFLIRLRGKKKLFGIDCLLGRAADSSGEDPPDKGLRFGDLFVKYVAGAAAELDPVEQELEELLRKTCHDIATCPIVARVTPSLAAPAGEAPARYRITLEVPRNGERLALSESVSAELYPLTVPTTARPLTSGKGLDLPVFDPLSFEALTSFYGCRLTAHKEGRKQSCDFVLNLPLEGAPSDRKNRILLGLLRNREQLLRYLLMLLSDDDEAARRLAEAFEQDEGNSHDRTGSRGFGLPLLEPLLRSLAQQPGRLDSIDRLVQDLQKTDEGSHLLGETFLSIWNPVWAMREGERHAD